MRRARGAMRAGVAILGLLLAMGGVVTIVAPGPEQGTVSASASGEIVALMLIGAAIALTIAGVVAWVARPGSGLAIVSFWAAAAWLSPEIAGSASVTSGARTLALVAAPFAAPLLVHVPMRALRADQGAGRLLLGALYAGVAIAAIGHALTWDAFRVYDCSPVCRRGDNLLGWFVDIPVSGSFRAAGWWLAASAGGCLAGWSALRLRRRGSDGTGEVAVACSALFVGVAMIGWAGARLAASGPSPVDPWSVRTGMTLGAAVICLGATVARLRRRQERRAARVRGLVELLDAGAGSRSLGETLATILRDPTVRVVYPVDDPRAPVDEMGRVTTPPSAGGGRAVSAIERAGTVVALVEHDAGLDPDLLSREVGAAARLAVDNERLAAMLRAQVRELQASRGRIVATGDAVRRRLERNLHDGAQQRLLAVSYELRLAGSAAGEETADRQVAIAASTEGIDRALADLRELAHGIWPAVLGEAGLEAALGSLADESPIPITLAAITEARFPAPVEAAAYLAVTDALRRAIGAAASEMVVRAQQVTGGLRLEVGLPGVSQPGPWLRVEDRVGAAGGHADVAIDPAGSLLSVELPCA